MAHGVPGKPLIDGITKSRLEKLDTRDQNGMQVLDDFAMFLDTHRDQPHVGVFFDDIHRGMCRPTKVNYIIGDDLLVNTETGETLPRHEKHMFVTNDYFAQFMIDYLMENGTDPRDGSGCLPTSHFRDARAKVFHLKSFREIVRLRFLEEEQARRSGKGRKGRSQSS